MDSHSQPLRPVLVALLGLLIFSLPAGAQQNWRWASPLPAAVGWKDVAFGNGLYVAVGGGGSCVLGSRDSNLKAAAANFASVGAFNFPANSRDAALVATLQPGNDTAQVSRGGGTTGIALVEVYALP